MRHTYALIIPALNEAESIGRVLGRVPRGLFCQVIVADNGSLDRTAEVAAATGAEVVREPRRGYGQACSSGIRQVKPCVTAIAFMDADLSDHPEDLEDRKSTRLNSSHPSISYAVFRLKKKIKQLQSRYGDMQIVLVDKHKGLIEAASAPRAEGLARVSTINP